MRRRFTGLRTISALLKLTAALLLLAALVGVAILIGLGLAALANDFVNGRNQLIVYLAAALGVFVGGSLLAGLLWGTAYTYDVLLAIEENTRLSTLMLRRLAAPRRAAPPATSPLRQTKTMAPAATSPQVVARLRTEE
jgi:hypothetical protein